MKQNISISSLVFVVLLFITACNKENIKIEKEDGISSISIEGIIAQYSEDVSTRTGIVENNPNYGSQGEKFYWVDGDKVKLLFYANGDLNTTPYIVDYQAQVSGSVQSNQCSLTATSSTDVPNGTYTVYALYPADAWDLTGSNPTVSMPADNVFTKTGYASTDIGAYMFKKAKLEGVTIGSGNTDIQLMFNPLTSIIRFNINDDLFGNSKFASIEFYASKNIFPVKASMTDLNATEFTGQTFTSSIKVNIDESFQNDNGQIDIFVPILKTESLAGTDEFFISIKSTTNEQFDYGSLKVSTQLSFLSQGFKTAYSYYIKMNTANRNQSIAPRFARSNIVWDGSKLIFAITREDNTAIPANSQGVYFRWGSLVAVVPSDLPAEIMDQSWVGGTRMYARASYPDGHVLFSPTTVDSYEWTFTGAASGTTSLLPYADETSGQFATHERTEDDFASYNNGVGYDVLTNRGDICRYISDMGWVKGSWRLPTADEYDQLVAEQTPVTNGGSFTNIQVAPSSVPNHFGYYPVESGYWLGKGATSSGNILNPAVGLFVPSGGIRGAYPGHNISTGYNGGAWCASSYNSTAGFRILVGDPTDYGFMVSGNMKTNAYSIRCIRE